MAYERDSQEDLVWDSGQGEYVPAAGEEFTLTVSPTPNDAIVTLTATGYTQSGNSITVVDGTTVNYSVAKSGYTTQYGAVVVTETSTIAITLTVARPIVEESSIGTTVYDIHSKATKNKNTANGADEYVYNWVGTLAQYTAQDIEHTHPDWVCLITDDTSIGEVTSNFYTKAEIDTLLASYYTKTQIDESMSQVNSNITDINTRPSHYYMWTQTSLNSSGTSYKEHTCTITPKLGRPICLIFSTDANEDNTTDTGTWCYYGIKKNGTTVVRNIDEIRHAGQNIPLAISYLDTNVTAGTSVTYTFFIEQMAGMATYGETAEGYPREIAFEI